MRQSTVAIGLKIPDNEAYTALVALQRLGIDVARLERSVVWLFDDSGDSETLAQRVEANETLFNPNKHRLALVEKNAPRDGECWIEELGAHDEVREHLGGKGIEGIHRARRYTGWRLYTAANEPVTAQTLQLAVERLLCNPAIEKALFATL